MDSTTKVEIMPTEFIKENPKSGDLEKMVSDIVITIANGKQKDTYLIEAQINDDIEMSLRIFNYSMLVALDKRIISDDGSCMLLDMPSPAIIYLETSRTKDSICIKIRFPNKKSIVYEVPAFKLLQHSVSKLEGMALLLPFYILKIRNDLKKAKDSCKRRELSKELEGYIVEIAEALQRCKRNNYITDRDVAILLRRLSKLNKELYGEYEEFTEVDMTLKQFVHTGVDEAIAKAVAAERRKLKRFTDTGVDEAIAKAVAAERRKLKRFTDTGVDEAIAKAEKRSLKQGLSQGLIKTATAMKVGGEAVSKIMRYTGLSRQEIMGL